MPRWLLLTLLFLAAVQVVGMFWWRTRQRIRQFPHRAPVIGMLRGMLILFVGSMLVNAFGLASDVTVQNIEILNTGVDDPVQLLQGPVSLLVGSWALFSLIATAMMRGVLSEEDGDVAVLKGTISALEAMLKRFVLPLVGLGTVFGILGEGLVIAILFGELLFVWLLLRAYLFVRERSEPVQ